MYAFEGRILILHFSYFYIEASGGKHKSGRDEGEGSREGKQQVARQVVSSNREQI